jgi:lipid-A-disaccharide synthase
LSAAIINYFENPEETHALCNTFADMHIVLKRNASERAAIAISKLINR